jgi:oligopeptidase A
MPDPENNPLLEQRHLPAFSRIQPEHVVPAIDELIAAGKRTVDSLLTANGRYNWESLVAPLESMGDRLNRTWSPVRHLHSVADNAALREAYNACSPKLAEYATELGQNEQLFAAYQALGTADNYQHLDHAQQKIIENALRDFRLLGVDLPAEKKTRFKAISRRLSELSSRFQENVLDATQAWRHHVLTPEALAGLPETALELARQTAGREGLEGWVLTLELPSYLATITYADDPALRRSAYEAYTTRASEEGPHAGRWDNTAVIEETLSLRHELAQLAGFTNYGDYSLARKMAASTTQVLDFLTDLAYRARPVAERELDELRAYARQHDGNEQLAAWDIPYYTEKLRQHKYAVSQEDLRPYFPVPRVLRGLFAIIKRLYQVDVRRREGIDVWHPDVGFYDIYDAAGQLRGSFFLDLYARSGKRAGAWMDECVVRRMTSDGLQCPVAYLTCNFSPPGEQRPSLLTHDEVTTLFHEFGHGLHHLLTRVDYAGVSGINGVSWDAVELPSQMMEKWCWEQDGLALIAAHYHNDEPLPEALYRRLRAAKNFHTGLQTLRQLEFALFDFRLHLEYQPEQPRPIYQLLDEVRSQVAVVVPPPNNRFAHAFAHVFAGGYAAGYYSYKWAEVLASDAFASFLETGLFNPETGQRFLQTVLEQGGARDAMELFVAFRGREPTIDALLQQSGFSEEKPFAQPSDR